jgi:hypothetical protein
VAERKRQTNKQNINCHTIHNVLRLWQINIYFVTLKEFVPKAAQLQATAGEKNRRLNAESGAALDNAAS